MIIDAISDLHGYYPSLQGGDLLIVAGDLTRLDLPIQFLFFLSWLEEQEYKRKIFLAGNHDNYLESNRPIIMENAPSVEYLCDSGTEFEGLKIWGTPWTKTFPGMNPECRAFTFNTEVELSEKFKMIPDDVDILISHGPPHGYLDKIYNRTDPVVEMNVGSTALLGEIKRTMPKYLICGHIHEDYGYDCFAHNGKITEIFNVSYVDEYYEPVNKVKRITI